MTTPQDKPSLPCHPIDCRICGGTDWDKVNDAPCPDQTWCQAFLWRNGIWAVCEWGLDHNGPHQCCGFEWWDDTAGA